MKVQSILEGLNHGDLRGLVSNVFTVDRYTPKIGSPAETVVITFSVTYAEPSQDLAHFIETNAVDLLDVDAPGIPNDDNEYIVYVEVERSNKLYDTVNEILSDIDQITSKDGTWQYRAFNVKEIKDFTEENFNNDVITSQYEYIQTYKD